MVRRGRGGYFANLRAGKGVQCLKNDEKKEFVL